MADSMVDYFLLDGNWIGLSAGALLSVVIPFTVFRRKKEE